MKNIQGIDFLDIHNADADGRTPFFKEGEFFPPLLGRKFLGIIDSWKKPPGWQNNGSRHHRTGQGASPGFIQPCYQAESFGSDLFLKGLHAPLRLMKRPLSSEQSPPVNSRKQRDLAVTEESGGKATILNQFALRSLIRAAFPFRLRR